MYRLSPAEVSKAEAELIRYEGIMASLDAEFEKKTQESVELLLTLTDTNHNVLKRIIYTILAYSLQYQIRVQRVMGRRKKGKVVPLIMSRLVFLSSRSLGMLSKYYIIIYFHLFNLFECEWRASESGFLFPTCSVPS